MTISTRRIELPLPWGGSVYPTIIDSPSARVLVDCGHTSAASRAALIQGLADRPPDLLLMTHAHQDHYGGLPALAEHFPGLPVYAARCAQSYYEDQRTVVLAHRDHLAAFAQRVGVDGLLLAQLLKGYDQIAESGCTTRLERLLDDGDEIEVGEIQIRAHHHPGHHHHHLVFELEQLDSVVSGDNVLATNLAPPEVRFDDQGKRISSLPVLLESLDRIALIGGRALPAHGEELPDVSLVARRAKAAYERTSLRVLRALEVFDEVPDLPTLLEAVFGEVPLPFVGLRLGFLLGYADLVGAGDNYR